MAEDVADGANPQPSHGIVVDIPELTGARPSAVRFSSGPTYQSPLRHHRRRESTPREVKETRNARSQYSNSEEDGRAEHRVNQYTIQQEIGRGSFGAVHLAVDQFGTEYAVKEFSKSRLRKRAQSNLLRRPHAPRRAQQAGLSIPLHERSGPDILDGNTNNSFDLIREEIAIMKKLHHNNLVSLIEVLDDPDEDSLYMVLEMCKKGVVMRVSIDERADPYDEETCRCLFRDLILGIEYLHAQGVVHRDIKPDNCLLTGDGTLKVVDFGVSEMFQRDSEMVTNKSAGSPAFMPPELCVAKHGEISGKAVDIWSMGATLYCLRFGRIPFERSNVLDLYEAIKEEPLDLERDCEDNFRDLMQRILEKNPNKRITMAELREHPWVSKNGTDPLLSAEENTANIVDEPTEEEMKHAITGNMGNLVVMVKAVKSFKRLLSKPRPEMIDSILGNASRMVQPPISSIREAHHRVRGSHTASHSVDAADRKRVETALTVEGIHRDIPVPDDLDLLPEQHPHPTTSAPYKPDKPHANVESNEPQAQSLENPGTSEDISSRSPDSKGGHVIPDAGKGHAHDPLLDTLFLDIGPGPEEKSAESEDVHIVCESPSATEQQVYEAAYKEEIGKLLVGKGKSALLFMTRRVENDDDVRQNPSIIGCMKAEADAWKEGFAAAVGRAKDKVQAATDERVDESDNDWKGGLAAAVGRAKEKVQGAKANNADGTTPDDA